MLAPPPRVNPGSATVMRHIHPDETPHTSSYREDLEKVSQLPDLIGTNAASTDNSNIILEQISEHEMTTTNENKSKDNGLPVETAAGPTLAPNTRDTMDNGMTTDN